MLDPCPPAPRRTGLLALGLTAVLLSPALGTTTPAAAAPAGPGPQRNAAMGSTVRAHEGVGRAVVAPATFPTGPRGLDVSSHQGDVDWASVYAQQGRFAYVKATEGTTYVNPYYPQQYDGSAAAGLLHGAYHFALPDRAPGTAQADFFVGNGGGWTADGATLPPLLDIEYDPYSSDPCYGLTPAAMVTWVRDFVREVRLRTGRNPAVFTTAGWWNRCTGSSTAFGYLPLMISHWNTTLGPLPAGWTRYRIWQFSPKGRFPGQQDIFPGTLKGLQRFARGGPPPA